jgi:hypothetical protein
MARSNLSHGSLRFESAVIIHRLRSYRPFDHQSGESKPGRRRRRSARPLFAVPQALIPEPGPAATQSGSDCLAGR